MTGPAADGIVIRRINEGDLLAVVTIMEAGSLVAGKEELRDLAHYIAVLAELTDAPGGVLVADEGDDVVGVCQLIVFRHLQNRGGLCAEIESVHVRADRRGRGIGRQLMEAAIEQARHLGCYRVQLTSNQARPEAHRFYEDLGFQASHVGFKLPLG